MKPTPTLNQKLGPCEYVYSRGAATADRAERVIENLLCEGEISLCEKPREVEAAMTAHHAAAMQWARARGLA